MTPALYIALVVIFIVLFINKRENEQVIAKKIQKKKGDNTEMLELAKSFIGKECIIYTFNNNQITGVIREVSNGGMLVEKNDVCEAINLDFVVRIREYPRNKNGKKKSIVLD